MRKKRILFCGEATYLNTGYATYGREVLKRLHATGKYELGEFASYGTNEDSRANGIPWTFYPNMPNGKEDKEEYDSIPTNQFGEWKFESVLLDFLPDIVFDIRDFWMFDYQNRSPYRQYFHWAIMPTVDASPQNEQWIETFASADGVFNYSDWGHEVLKSQSNNTIKCLGAAPPSADAMYKPVEDKEAHKEAMGFDKNVKFVGTVMRNQKRKLFPDLFETFRKFLDTSQRKDVLLYCHTSYPDLGWDIPKLLLKNNLSSKVVFTYVCSVCQHTFPAFFSDARRKCQNCNSFAAGLSSVQKGASCEYLASVMNLFDLYIQYASSEGFGLPQVEAAACGVPVMSVDYSAMSSVVRKLGGFPVKVKALYSEVETGCDRAVPDNDHAAKTIQKFFDMDNTERETLAKNSNLNFKKYYQWDKTAKKWEDHFDSVEIKPITETWQSPPRIHQPLTKVPSDLSTSEYARWLIVNVLGEPERLNTFFESRLIRDLNYGMYINGTGDLYLNEDSYKFIKPAFEKFEKEEAYNMMVGLCLRRNKWELARSQSIQ
jgi:glycosyltransferase involved in cell wall biosynthesis|tara:strand:- start:14341 stop:15972 length:1632 start_codon:yes stop_codon:yes gene_type:complete